MPRTVDEILDALARDLAELKAALPELVRAVVADEIEPLRQALIKPVGAPAADDLIDAIEVARLLGRDLSTVKKKRAAVQAVYELARGNAIKHVRVSPRRLKFSRASALEFLAGGGLRPASAHHSCQTPESVLSSVLSDYAKRE